MKHNIEVTFVNSNTGEEFTGTRNQCAAKFGVSKQAVHASILGENLVKGWGIKGVVYINNQGNPDRNVYNFTNVKTGEIVRGTRQQAMAKMGITYSKLVSLIYGETKKTYCNWVLGELTTSQIATYNKPSRRPSNPNKSRPSNPNKSRYTGRGRPRDKTVYTFINTDGQLVKGTRGDLYVYFVKNGLANKGTQSNIALIVNGLKHRQGETVACFREFYKGWTCAKA